MGNAASTQHHEHQASRHILPQRMAPLHPATTNDHAHKALHTTETAAHSASLRKPCACAHMHPHKTCLSYLVSSFGRSFYLAYGIRAGISLALHIIKLLKTSPRSVFDVEQLVGAHGLPVDAVRMGLFLGCFTGLYNGIRCLLARWLGRDDAWTVAGAGFVAGLSIKFHPADSHRTLALYILARVFQCWYNKQKAEGKWHLWGSDWKHGDSLLFSICSAQVMYAYAMRPDTLPAAYFKFIVDTGPIPLKVLDAVKANNRGLPVDLPSLEAVCSKLAPAGSKPATQILAELAAKAYGPGAPANMPPIIPCSLLHPHNPLCSHQWLETFVNTAKRTLPLYLTLTFVPMFVLRFWAVVRHPVDSLLRGCWSVTKSTSFLSSFVSLYMFLICMQRRAVTQDHRAIYWIAGFISSWTILLEQKSRRSELALYVLPRTLDSLIMTMQHRKLLSTTPHAEKLLFCLGMSSMMYYREFHSDTMSPLLKRVLNFFVPSYKSLPKEHTADQAISPAQSPAQHAVGGADAQMQRCNSDGLSASSIDGVIPLPQAGISLSREQSASQFGSGSNLALPSFIANSTANGARPASNNVDAARGGVMTASPSYNLFARDLSPTSSPISSASAALHESSPEDAAAAASGLHPLPPAALHAATVAAAAQANGLDVASVSNGSNGDAHSADAPAAGSNGSAAYSHLHGYVEEQVHVIEDREAREAATSAQQAASAASAASDATAATASGATQQQQKKKKNRK